MCVVSMIGDHFNEKWREPYKPYTYPNYPVNSFQQEVSKEEFDQLKREVEELKALLKRAKIYDEKNNEPNCEIEEKMEFLRKVAELVGIDLNDVIKDK